jgi:ribosomal 30S subunit maturation factor RimM
VDGQEIGVVREVEATMGGGHLVVDGRERGEILIPLVAEICRSVDVASKRIVIDAPAGLLDLNR